MGAIVGGLYSTGVSLEQIESVMRDKSLRNAYLPGWIPPKLLMQPVYAAIHPRRKNQYAGLFDNTKFIKFLGNMMPNKEDTLFSDCKIPFTAVATNLLDGNAYSISSGNLPQALSASSAISPLVKPVEIGDKVYVDGGVRANLPARAARESGAKVVIGVLVDEPLKVIPKDRYKKFKNVAFRISDIVLAVNDEHQLPFADIVINPDVSGIPVFSKNPKDVDLAILAGEKAARRAMPAIKKALGLPYTEPTVAEQKIPNL